MYAEYEIQWENQSYEHDDNDGPNDNYSTNTRRGEGNRMQDAIATAMRDEYSIRIRWLGDQHGH